MLEKKTTKIRMPGLTHGWAGCWAESSRVMGTTIWSSCEHAGRSVVPGEAAAFPQDSSLQRVCEATVTATLNSVSSDNGKLLEV